jgi:SAM-dependent methyltransferase
LYIWSIIAYNVKMNNSQPPKLYTDLAAWWPLLSPPEDYAEEAAFYRQTLDSLLPTPPHEVLELGSGGGSNASHLKQHYRMTLVDLAPGMIEVSQRLNPTFEHHVGDMRTVRLGRLFDAVFIHDAIDYMTTLADLRRALETAAIHCKPGGALLVMPDFVREMFQPTTGHGGEDGGDRALRYLEWTWDPDPADTSYVTDYAYVLRAADGQVECIHDRHICGLFSTDEWLNTLQAVGFQAQALPSPIGSEEGGHLAFVGIKRAG